MEAYEGLTMGDFKHDLWKSSLPFFYDWIANKKLVRPSLSCRWGSRGTEETFTFDQQLYFTRRGNRSVQDALVIANVEMVKLGATHYDDISQFDTDSGSLFVKSFKTIIHPGEINRIRELPMHRSIVATHTDSPDVFIWNVDKPCFVNSGAAAARPDLVLKGHKDNAEFALATCRLKPLVLSGGKDQSVVLWNLEDHIEAPSSNSPGLSSCINNQSEETGDVKNVGPTLDPRGVYRGHRDSVQDVQFCPLSVDEFCSVGDDACLILWDARSGTKPVITVERAHDVSIFCVDWNHHNQDLILTGSADKSVRLFDRRKPILNGVGSPMQTFEGHDAYVLCLQWCPHRASMFGSADVEGVIDIWDLETVGEFQKPGWEMPPGLYFQHVGHRDTVVDFQWNPDDPLTIVSVSEDGERRGNGGTLQVWRVQESITKCEDLKFKDTPKLRKQWTRRAVQSRFF